MELSMLKLSFPCALLDDLIIHVLNIRNIDGLLKLIIF